MYTISSFSYLNIYKNDAYVPIFSDLIFGTISAIHFHHFSTHTIMVHEYVLYVPFVAPKIVLRHPKRDASKNVPTPTVSENYEILCGNLISRDDSNGTIRFIIRDLENKLRIFNRNYNFVIEITIFALIPKIGISRVLQ